MNGLGIIIVGLNGCGKTTLGRTLAQSLGAFPMDVETYYFPPSDAVPFTVSRSKDEVRQLLLNDMARHPRFVLSSVNGNYWGDAIESRLRCAVFLSAPLETRLARIENRERLRFGARVLPGGDMYDQQRQFRAYAAARDESAIETWLSAAGMPVLRLDARDSIEHLVARAADFYRGLGL